MEEEMKFTCGKCGHQWKESDYDIESSEHEGFYAQGLYCPKCESDDVGGKKGNEK